MEPLNPAMTRTLDGPFDTVLAKIIASLKDQGFGILTRIDVRATLKEKLDVDFRRYEILGACNPPLAHRALQADLDVGLMLPCNVIVHELDDGTVRVAAFDPMGIEQGNPAILAVAEEARARLERAVAALDVAASRAAIASR